MQKHKINNIFTGEDELKTVEEMTDFRVNQRVIHRNEGEYAGSAGVIKRGVGTIKELKYHGFGFLGHTITANVTWESGEKFTLNVCLLQDEKEKRVSVNPDALRIFK